MFSEDYTDIIMDHFMCPRNVGIIKEINGEGISGDPECVDSLRIYINVKNNLIEDISIRKEIFMGKVVSLNISEKRGVEKIQVFSINAIEGFGIEGDGHAGAWDRQVSVFPIEALEKVPYDKIEEVKNGGFTENITIEGVSFDELNVGSVIQIGEAMIKIVYIGKEEYKEHGRPYIVSREGRFGTVIKSGKINIGDLVEAIKI
ncbi:iron-sulfur cluster assembly scaffold protein [Clostridium sp. PL3]|uniref:Iron-sulfur cluster assembly scaffold protein n=1 Tax=Clostridium thailandense TaxID=2794346 RepID=A0A949TYD0_9CLOT|nr:iron-sulfur cluster assembly scaffold protein [Clostridium thailandense]MBV7274111.1 iron-sulfur cluster assembly scaffold protein [Clostridium thailandense]